MAGVLMDIEQLSGYRVIVEPLYSGAAARSRLLAPDGRELGVYIQRDANTAVESACSDLMVLGSPDEARAIARHWREVSR